VTAPVSGADIGQLPYSGRFGIASPAHNLGATRTKLAAWGRARPTVRRHI